MSDFAVLMFGSIGFTEIIAIFFVALLLFGSKRLPEIAKSLGNALNEFKKTKDDIINYKEPTEPTKDLPETKIKDDKSEN